MDAPSPANEVSIFRHLTDILQVYRIACSGHMCSETSQDQSGFHALPHIGRSAKWPQDINRSFNTTSTIRFAQGASANISIRLV